MGAGLVIAFLMLKSRAFKPLASLGILANALLLGGDLATGGSRAPFTAALVGVGYVLLIAWFLLIGARLTFERGTIISRRGAEAQRNDGERNRDHHGRVKVCG